MLLAHLVRLTLCAQAFIRYETPLLVIYHASLIDWLLCFSRCFYLLSLLKTLNPHLSSGLEVAHYSSDEKQRMSRFCND